MATINALFDFASRILLSLERHFYTYLRIAIFLVMAWIGGLKVCQYEADGIVPFVSNSPFMSFLYNNSSKTAINPKNGKEVKEYNLHKNKEGEVIVENIKWHQENGTYAFSIGLGLMICTIGTLVLLGIWSPRLGMLGGLLTFGISSHSPSWSPLPNAGCPILLMATPILTKVFPTSSVAMVSPCFLVLVALLSKM